MLVRISQSSSCPTSATILRATKLYHGSLSILNTYSTARHRPERGTADPGIIDRQRVQSCRYPSCEKLGRGVGAAWDSRQYDLAGIYGYSAESGGGFRGGDEARKPPLCTCLDELSPFLAALLGIGRTGVETPSNRQSVHLYRDHCNITFNPHVSPSSSKKNTNCFFGVGRNDSHAPSRSTR